MRSSKFSWALGVGILLLGARWAVADPAVPVLVAPASNAVQISTSPLLQVKVSEPGGGPLKVTFFGRLAQKPAPDFTLAALPDSQYYSAVLNGGTAAMFAAQTDWIVSHRIEWNIAYVAHLGDIVHHGDTNAGSDNLAQWRNATNALYRLENPLTTGLTYGIPYGLAVGNHDQSPNGAPDGTTRYYSQFFGYSHFAGRSYYGGRYGTNNDNHFDLFSTGGLDFVAVFLEYDTNANPAVLAWANSVLRTYPARRAIVVSHYIGRATTPSTFCPQGAAIYTALRTNANLFLMLNGHVSGEGARTDVFNGNSVHTFVADYQSYDNGGNGWMRLLQFSPSNSVIRVKTFSPWLDQFETDDDSQFTVPYSMPPTVSESSEFLALGTNLNVASGATTGLLWPELLPNHTYEWYVTATDSSNRTVAGPAWRFTTRQETAPKGASAGLLRVAQIPGFIGEDENTNCAATLVLGVNEFTLGSANRGDYSVQAGWSATDDSALGVLLASVAQNGRDNYGSNVFSTCGITTNASGAYRVVTFGCPNASAGDGFEYNVNAAAAWFPYAEWIGGFVRNNAGTNGGVWNLFTGSPGLVLGTHVVSLGSGRGIVDLRGFGIDSRTHGVLLVNHARDEANFALSQVNSSDGTWNVFVHDNSTDTSTYEQDPFAFVFIPRTNTSVISGRFLGNAAIALYSGASPAFTVSNLATGRYELKIPGHSPASGVLLLSAEGGSTYNLDNIVTFEPNSAADGWIIESRDLPAGNPQTPGTDPVASFVFIPAPPAGLTVSPTNRLVTTEAGGTAAFTVVLDKAPSADVVVQVAASDPTEGAVVPAVLTFSTNDWKVAQTVTITGVDDAANDGNISYTVTCTPTSADPAYAALAPVSALVTNLDDEEGLTLPSGVLYYGVGMPAVALDGRATVVDPDAPSYDRGSLTVGYTANGTGDDRLELRHAGSGPGQIGVAGGAVTFGGIVVGTWSGGSGTAPLTVLFTSAMTRAAAEALVRTVTFRNVSSRPSLAPRTVSVVLVDGNDLASAAAKTIRVGSVSMSDFQEGANGGYGPYTGAADLELYQSAPTTAYPSGHSVSGLWVDYPDSQNACQLLLRFDNILGTSPGQIPPRAVVVSAELILNANNTGDGSPLYRMLQPWKAATDTWNTWGAGIQTNDVEARGAFDSQIGCGDSVTTGTGTIAVDVTPDVQAWINGQTNCGWMMPGWPACTDGTAFSPSEAANVEERPRLRVRWVPSGTAAASFRQGVGGYANASDTRIRANAPDTTAATLTSLWADAAVSGSSDPEQVLLRFDRLVGSATNQVPPGARIEAAALDLASVFTNAPGDGATLHLLLQSWLDTTSTWNKWGNGIQADDVEAVSTPTLMLGNASLAPNVPGGFHTLDVTDNVQAWTSGSRSNCGWVFLPLPGGSDGWGFASSEAALERNRPRLRVYYTPAANVPVWLLPPVCGPGTVQIRFSTAPGMVRAVQRAASVAGPWSTLGTVIVGQDGLGALIDSAPLSTSAFYRVALP